MTPATAQMKHTGTMTRQEQLDRELRYLTDPDGIIRPTRHTSPGEKARIKELEALAQVTP